ncbi:GNAT family N-acetyltransferase [Microvirga puerhi]|uniref:GNAT family N-acetyltransferase n=1 Tax=Microvirga puerhi TaxID=2876078 RepID=A0ABS7VLC1_9HYPH|nr:GNAT family N-acetyltransferase [Microvirga puerhi]MBZ6076325.1 GNAT family N-acetyltransferase [Microvirga puerhi]
MTEVDHSDSFLNRISVRSHVPQDFELLGRMNRELIEDQAHRNPMTIDQLRDRFKRLVADGWKVDLFEVDGEVIGYAVHRYEPDPAEPRGERVFLRQFFIARHRRRGGAGSVALKELMRARFQAGDRIYLDVIEANPGGKMFWTRTGFVPYATIMERVVSAEEVETI